MRRLATSLMGHMPKGSLGANLVGTTSDSRHRLLRRGFLSRANFGLPRCKKIAGDILRLMQADPARCSVSSDICRCAAIPISARLARDPTCEGLAVKFLGSTGHQRLIRDVTEVSATHPIAPIWHKAAASCESLLQSHWHEVGRCPQAH